MKKTSFLISILAIILTSAILLDNMVDPTSIIQLGFMLWAISPYILLLILVKKATRTKAASIGVLILTILLSLFGLGLIIDAIYIQTDAQGAFVFIFVPLCQWIGLLLFLLSVVLYKGICRLWIAE